MTAMAEPPTPRPEPITNIINNLSHASYLFDLCSICAPQEIPQALSGEAD